MQTEKSCGAVVFTRTNDVYEFLIITHKAGHHGFPKGHVEAGETEVQTALREVYEETGAPIEILEGFRAELQYEVKNHVLKTVVYFLAKAVTKEVVLPVPEITASTWATLPDALALLTHENHQKLLIQAYEYLITQISP
jgi:bis(5'-nucleosidyl)-tetraphosphatase